MVRWNEILNEMEKLLASRPILTHTTPVGTADGGFCLRPDFHASGPASERDARHATPVLEGDATSPHRGARRHCSGGDRPVGTIRSRTMLKVAPAATPMRAPRRNAPLSPFSEAQRHSSHHPHSAALCLPPPKLGGEIRRPAGVDEPAIDVDQDRSFDSIDSLGDRLDPRPLLGDHPLEEGCGVDRPYGSAWRV